MTAILGISAFYHDSAAALIVDGEIVAAAQEERFTRKKHDEGFPTHALEFCLRAGGLRPEQLDYVGFYDKPFLKFERLLETYLAYAPRGFRSFVKSMPIWLQQKLHLPRELNRGLQGKYRQRFIFTDHHESHAASAFFPSPFAEAAILTIDGVGEWATATCGVGRGNEIELLHEMRFPHSPGLLYSAFTYYCGFTVNSGEYKLMGLAPYGSPKYVDLILDKLVKLHDDGSFQMDMSYFNYCQGLTMTSDKFHRLFGAPPRKPDSLVTSVHMDVAASIQKVTEQIMLNMARFAHRETGMRYLCLAGGVALNCVANGRILREGPFEDLWIQPAAGDAGGALGVAQFIWHQLLKNPRTVRTSDTQKGSLLGSYHSNEEIGSFLESTGAQFEYFADEQSLCDHVSDAIIDGKVIGWFRGRMEFGPRALGARSIIGDARHPEMQTVMNTKVKFRESFRPFAPVVLKEHASEYFDMRPGQDSPYMLLVAPVLEHRRLQLPPELATLTGIDKLKQKRSEVPAITHVDYSARVQTVDEERHRTFHRLMQAFYTKTGCPVMINTSFNLGWDPIVCTPQDAYETFMASDIDVLCLENYVLTKARQPAMIRPGDQQQRSEYLQSAMQSPCHATSLREADGKFICDECDRAYTRTDGIWQMFWPHDNIDADTDVTEKVKAFYEETPFPNYEDHDSIRTLIDRARGRGYARALDQSIPYNSRVLEVGCGTGQLSNFLGVSCRRVIGTDLCLNSLRMAESFRSREGLDRVSFVQMNPFRPCFPPEQFDVVLCNGIRHPMVDPFGGFRGLVPLVKPGGHIVIGLYNTYGRLMADTWRKAFRLMGNRCQSNDPNRRNVTSGAGQMEAWCANRSCHPHESRHTIDEVLEWFDQNGIEFVRGIPSVCPDRPPFAGGDLFVPEPRGSRLDHALVQLREIVIGNREGGFFLMIGRKVASHGERRSLTRSVETAKLSTSGSI